MARTLDIVIVNWNSGTQLRECLASIPGALAPALTVAKVIVVDNASTDGSASGLAEELPAGLPLEVLHSPSNLGFAAGCNAGARRGTADHVLFLNPDTRLFARSLAAPMDFMEAPENATVGICGVQLLDEAGEVARTCARFPSPRQLFFHAVGLDRIAPRRFRPAAMVEWDHATTREVDQLMGAFFWIRRGLFEALGGFDERFFVYYEEVDLSLRAARAGHRSVYLSTAQAFHKGGGTTEGAKAARLIYSVRSRILYARKHFAAPARLTVTVSALALEPLARLIHAARARSATEASNVLRAYRVLLAEHLLPRKGAPLAQ